MAPGNLAHVTPGELNTAVISAVRDAVADGELVVPVPDSVPVHATAGGGYATPLALRLASDGQNGHTADEIARSLAARLNRRAGIESADVTGSGFITVTTSPLTSTIDERYGLTAIPAATWPTRPLNWQNPGFVVRFAYARACAVRRYAEDLGYAPTKNHRLDDPREQKTVGLIADFPGKAQQARRKNDSRPFARHLERLAGAYHDVHEHCPALPKGDRPFEDTHAARIHLARAVRITLGNGLRMLGETPSDRL